MYFVNPKMFFSQVACGGVGIYSATSAVLGGQMQSEDSSWSNIFFLVVHIPTFLRTNCLKRNAGTVFSKYFSEPCTTREVKNLRILRRENNCGNLSPALYFMTVLTHLNLFLKTKIKNVLKKSCCVVSGSASGSLLVGFYLGSLQRLYVFSLLTEGIRYKVECVYCLKLYCFLLSCCQQLTETEMGSRNLNIWECLCLSLCPEWNKIWNT